MSKSKTNQQQLPTLRDVGLDGVLVTFAKDLDDRANRAAIAFRSAFDDLRLDGVQETMATLASAFVRYDPLTLPRADLVAALQNLIRAHDWRDAPLPHGRVRWEIPAAFGGDYGPQLAEAAALAGHTADTAVADMAATTLRVMTLGFAPGQPYLGQLADHWNIPRQTGLTAQVPWGALGLAIRQMVLFTNDTPTGWRHVGRVAFANFQPLAPSPFPLSAGDEVVFTAVDHSTMADLLAAGPGTMGGARKVALT